MSVGWLWLLGCTHLVVVTTHPAPATLSLGEHTYTSPAEVACPWLGRCRVVVTHADHRTFTATLRFRRFALKPGRVEVVLVPAHGPSGTWTPEDQGLVR